MKQANWAAHQMLLLLQFLAPEQQSWRGRANVQHSRCTRSRIVEWLRLHPPVLSIVSWSRILFFFFSSVTRTRWRHVLIKTCVGTLPSFLHVSFITSGVNNICLNFPLAAVIGQTKLLPPEKMKHSIKLVDDQMNWCDSAMEVRVHFNPVSAETVWL